MATATLITDFTTGLAPRVRQKGKVEVEGERHYRVDADDIAAAFNADGMPAWGDPWDAGNPSLLRRELESVSHEGVWTTVKAIYRTHVRGYPVGAAHGVAWTDVERNLVSGTVTHARDQTRLSWNGASVDLLQYRVLVHLFTETPQIPQLVVGGGETDLSEGLTPVNSDQLTLPPIRGGDIPIPIPAGRARYLGYDYRLVGIDLFEITHELLVALDWLHREYKEDDQGNVVGPRQDKEVYPTMALMPVLGLGP